MGFMIPVAERFTAEEAAEYTAHEFDDREPEDFEAGWYSRLSAPGYMDATDWMGPYATADEALREVMEFYEVDENGGELPEEEPDRCGECGEYWPCSVQKNRESYRPDVVVMHTIKRGN